MRIAAVDIGGTAIKSGIWDGKELTGLQERETKAFEGAESVMERVKDILRGCGNFEAVGVSTAGQVDTDSGSIHYANGNLPGYTGMRVRDILEEEFGVPVAVENDVNAAALGEMHCGGARGLDSFLCLTYGTGVGGAIVMNGKVWTGSTWAGGSFGGILVHPEQWNACEEWSGCYEKYASVTALVQRVGQIDPSLDDGRKIFAAMKRQEIREAVDQWINEIVYGLVTLIHIFNPAHILLGGGILAQTYVLEGVRKRVMPRLTPDMRKVEIRRTGLGNQAGLMGVSALASALLE